ncbi:hypothetical protein QYM36_012996 [Artemia franciscana]|uniref:Endonuclease/exonuclease/phosphatase domain-containing protein n=1 Tax=Artemia franciscana TaxID=6661 RepID=A0AA88L5Z1_ARTSF|nr:hypothetical protein QYM36_012996 [Artemia franciscana]
MKANSACLRTDFMTAKKHLRLGFLNVSTLREGNRLDELVERALKFQLDIFATSETRRLSFGTEKLKGYKFLFTGQNDHHCEGVGLLLSTEASKALLERTLVKSCILTARFASQRANMTTVPVYAPTNDRDSNIKDELYRTLKDIIRAAHQHNIMCVLGDHNAKFVDDTEYAPSISGRLVVGNLNEN